MTTQPPLVHLDAALWGLVAHALRLSLRNPSLAWYLLRARGYLRRAQRRRELAAVDGLHVPPIVIASITRRCNLHCAGCYAFAQHGERAPEPELSPDQLWDVARQARDLGVSVFLVSGGEPFLRPEILDIAAAMPEMLFPVFTNGYLIDDAAVARLRTIRNLVPILSLEGAPADTDARRGPGTHDRVLATMRALTRAGALCGTSLTLTRRNFGLVTAPTYARDLVRQGCRLFILVDFVAAEPGTDDLTLTSQQKAAQPDLLAELRRRIPALFVALPGDPSVFQGCLAAGRGFVHISPEGRVEPCPFAPISAHGLKDTPLRDALASPFLSGIRESGVLQRPYQGSCSLWRHRAWVRGLVTDPTTPPPPE